MRDLERIIEPYTYMYTSKFNGYIVETKIEHPIEAMLYIFRDIRSSAANIESVPSFVENNKGKVFLFNSKIVLEDIRSILYTLINNCAMSNYHVAVINAIQLRFGQSVEIPDNCDIVLIDSLFFNNSNYILEEVRRVIDSALEKRCILFMYTISDYVEDILFTNLKMSFDRDKTTVINFNNFA